MIELLTLLLASLFGTQLRKVPPIPVSEDDDSTDPVPPVPMPATAPQIIIPKPENKDAHGPASSIARAMLRKGYTIFEKDDQPYNLNIVAVRTSTPEFDRFRCRSVVFSKYQEEWTMKSWPITTLPGHRYMIDKLLSPLGCAILAEGQYVGVYRLDYHRSLYQALCQRAGAVRVYRDKNRDKVYDMSPLSIQTGEFGINRHATENPDDGISNPVADRIGAASAGCLVNARVNDFVEERELWRLARNYWGSPFTLTLLNESDLDDAGTIPTESVPPQHSEPESWSPPAPSSTGTRNRNLLNVKQGSDPWKYSTGKDSRGHTIFPNYASGIRAGIITLRTYWVKHKLRSIDGIVSRWAPASDTVGSIAGNPANDPSGYGRFVEKSMGYPRDKELTTFNADGSIRSADQLFLLVAAMVKMECGGHVVLPRHVFDAGLKLV
jgi:hypothetical protein